MFSDPMTSLLPSCPSQVDCCLTTSEIQRLLSQSGVTHLSQVPLGETDRPSPRAPSTSTSIAELLLQGTWGDEGTVYPMDHDKMDAGDDMEVDQPESCAASLTGASVPPTHNDSGRGGGGLFGSPAAGGSGGYMDFVFRRVAALV